MKVKELLAELKKQDPDDEVVLWRWTDKGSIVEHLAILLQHKKHKGFYEIGINEHLPSFSQEEWHDLPTEE